MLVVLEGAAGAAGAAGVGGGWDGPVVGIFLFLGEDLHVWRLRPVCLGGRMSLERGVNAGDDGG